MPTTLWSSIGPTSVAGGSSPLGNGGQLIDVLVAAPASGVGPSTIYAAGPRCGAWKSTDNGTTWQSLTDQMPAPTYAVNSIALDPTIPGRLYVVITQPKDPITWDLAFECPAPSLLSSNDGGVTWNPALSLAASQVGRLFVDLAYSYTLYMATLTGLLRSNDGGVTWNQSKAGGEIYSFVLDPLNPDTAFAALKGVGIFKTTSVRASVDTSWTLLSGGLPPTTDIGVINIAMSPSARGILYAVIHRPSVDAFEIYATSDGGTSWTLNNTFPPHHYLGGLLAVDPIDPNTVYFGGVYFHVSPDGGKSVFPDAPIHQDQHGIAFDPLTPGSIYVVNDGGIYQSPDRGKTTWRFIGASMRNLDFWDIATSPTRYGYVVGGMQDNGTASYDGSTTLWSTVPDNNGDTGEVEIDPANEDVLYTLGQYYSQIQMSTDGGKTWAPIGTAGIVLPPGAGPTGNPDIKINSATGHLLLCQAGLFAYDPATRKWSSLIVPSSLGGTLNGNVIVAAVDAKNSLVYAGTDQGELWGANGETGFTVAWVHPAAARIHDIAVIPNDPSRIYVAAAGVAANRVCQLVRSSGSPIIFTDTDITANLPVGVAPQSLVFARPPSVSLRPPLPSPPMPPTLQLYAGTNMTVYRGTSRNRGATWSWARYADGLPPCQVTAVNVLRVTELAPFPGGTEQRNLVQVATFGRGVYEVFPPD